MAVTQVKKEARLNVESITWGGMTWLNIVKPTERETEYLSQTYHFHPLNLDDVLSRIQRPKIDEYKDHLFVVLHFPVYDKLSQMLTSSEVDVFIGEDYLVTVDCTGELKPLDKFFRSCQIDEELRNDMFSWGSGFLLYRVIDRLVDYCLPILNKIGDRVEAIENEIFSERETKIIRDISVLRRDIISFRRTIWPMRAVISVLEPKLRSFTKKDMEVYFGDTTDHTDKIWDGLDEYKEIIEGLHDTHNALASHRINDAVRVLTILATIGAVLTVIFSFYGMNVPLPGGANPGGHPLTWAILILFVIIVTGGMLLYFHRKRWI